MSNEVAAKDRLEFLDVARGLAALLVLLEHGVFSLLPGYESWTAANTNLGRVGVVLFLAISGFIIPVSLERSQSNPRFWLRRFFRLFPAYWVSIVVGYLYLRFGGPYPLGVAIDDTSNWLLNFTMLQRFVSHPDVWPVYWTLQLELVIYAACSIMFAAKLLDHWKWVVGLAIVGYLVYGLERPLLEGKPTGIGGQRFMYFTPLMGLVVQRYVAGHISRLGTYLFFAAHLLSILGIWCVSRAYFPTQTTVFGLREFLLTWGTAYACLLTLTELRHMRMPAIGTWLGRISYSTYLFHALFLLLLPWAGAPVWVFVPGFFIGTILLSQVVYTFVEVPGIALGRRLEKAIWKARPATPGSLSSAEPRVAA